MTDLAGQIKAARERAGWTQQELADRVGVGRTTVRNWEAGTPPRNKLGRLVQLLGPLDGDVTPSRDDADGVLLDLPDEALAGLDEAGRQEVIAAAKSAALRRAREIRAAAGGTVGVQPVE